MSEDSQTENPEDEKLDTAADAGDPGENGDVEEKKEPLKLEVQVETKSACERHVLVKIAREDIEKYYAKQFDELEPKAEVPGFRPGKAPRKLIENRFRHQVTDQVKGEIASGLHESGQRRAGFFRDQ